MFKVPCSMFAPSNNLKLGTLNLKLETLNFELETLNLKP